MNRTDPNIPEQYRRRVAEVHQTRVSIGNTSHNNTHDLATLKAMVAGMAVAPRATAGTDEAALIARFYGPQPDTSPTLTADEQRVWDRIKANTTTAASTADDALYARIYGR